MIRNTLLLLPLLAIVLLYFLQEGITVHSLKIGQYKMQGLYLKLDNKLTLKIEKLEIPKEKKQEGMKRIDAQLRTLKRVLTLFEYIELNSVHFTNDTYKVIYADETIYIDSNSYEIAGMITPQKGGMVATLPLIHLKKQDVTLQGEMTYGYSDERITFKGRYALPNLAGTLRAEIQDKKVTFLLKSQETGSISPLLDMLEIPEETRVWMDKKVRAKHYRLLSLKGMGSIGKEGLKLDVPAMRGEALLQDVTIKFDTKLRPVVAKEVNVRFHDDRLDFDLKDPYYHRKGISGSQAALLNLTGKGHSRLLLKLKFHSPYDKEMKKILAAYDVQIPLEQKKGTLRAEVKLDVDLGTEETKVEGRVFVSRGSMLLLGGAPLHFKGGEITFTRNRVALWHVSLYDSWFDAVLNGFMNLDTKKAKFKVDINHLQMGNKKETSIVIGNKKKVPLLLSYGEQVQLDLPSYRIRINTLKDGGIKITNTDIRPLLPFVKHLPLQLSSGKFTLRTKDYRRYDFSGEATWKHSYLYQKGGYLSQIPFVGTYQKERLKLSVLNGNLVYDSKQSSIGIKNINIDVKKMMALYGEKQRKSLNKLGAKGSNSMIRYDKYVLLTDHFNFSIRGKNTRFSASKDGDRVRIEKNGDSLFVHADKIKDKMLQALIHFNGLRGGRYSLELLGSIKGELRGVINVKGGAIESFKAYNDLIALLNTIPALMTLSDPGFSQKGYVVRNGKIAFRIIGDQVVFDSIYIDGKSSTIAGKGTVSLKSGKLDIDLAVRTAREVGKVLGSLPLVGYILFGKDKSMTTGVKIVGTLDHPKAKTHPVQEALIYPLELLKRTITSPAHIINQ